MAGNEAVLASVIPFKKRQQEKRSYRKGGLNRNKEGSVRKINGKVYVDFLYLGERVRESSDLECNETNARVVREQLDKIIVSIKSGTFRFAEVFPRSKNREHFKHKEIQVKGLKKTPESVNLKNYMETWYNTLKGSGRVAQRTLFDHKTYVFRYLIPFFGEKSFADLNPSILENFVSWAKQRKYMDKEIKNESVNKILVPLRMACRTAAIEYGWGSNFNPFFGFKKLPEGDPYEKIFPFSIEEQRNLIEKISDHWKPYFRLAFCTGLRQGEQIGLKPGDIDWESRLLHIRRAMTLDENGKRVEGSTKNKYSRRTIKLTPVMFAALESQEKIYDQFKGEYFFCNTSGGIVNPSNLRRDVWWPALNAAKLKNREMKQTRHSFATIALSCGENPLWIARVMGHRNTDMIIRVYSKYVENVAGAKDGAAFDGIYQGTKSKNEEQ
jgi:integrase